MIRPTALLKRSLIFVHRWLGVALSVIFAFWFVSGIVMMYWSFPGVDAKDRLERAPVLDPASIKRSPEEAYAALQRDQPPGSITLTSFDGRPVYRFGAGGGGRGGRGGGRGRSGGGAGQTMVYAADGSQQGEVNDAMLDRVATAWTKQSPDTATKVTIEDVDQWTVGSQLRKLRPLYKYSFADGQQVYVSGRDANVVQYTTSQSRFWAYIGAIPHWFYFTPLRKHQPQWFQFVVWASGIGAVSAILGIVIGLWMYSPKKIYRYEGAATSIPYKGQKRWHTILGLFFGTITVTWAFSGLLSMGPFEFVEKITGTARPAAAQENGDAKGQGKGNRGRGTGGRGFNPANVLRGDGRFDMASYADKDPRTAIASLSPDFQVKELEFTQFNGEPIYMATDAKGDTRIVPVSGEPKTAFDNQQVMEMLNQAVGSSDVHLITQYDGYYLDRTRQRPLPVVYVQGNDENHTRYYIDPKTARVVGNYSSRNWVTRWLYHGLHSLDFPWLYNYRPLWDIVVITLMLGGTALCVTSLILTYRVLARKAVKAISSQSDDLSAV